MFINYKLFGGKIHNSVDEALKTVFQPELLENDNQYMCEVCQAKQNALKGFQINEMPDYVTLYVNRFEIDFETMQRNKVKGKMHFGEQIDFSKYINKDLINNMNKGSVCFDKYII